MIIMKRFAQLLWRYRFLLVGIPLATAMLTFVLVRRLPDKYVSQARVATGIVNRPDALLNTSAYVQEAKVAQEFSNVIELFQMKKTLTKVSYQLLLHDLTSNDPFSDNKLLVQLSPQKRKSWVALLHRKYATAESLYLTNPAEKELGEMLNALHYDEVSLRKQLSVYRVNTSDFIDLKYEGSHPLLTRFTLQTLVQEAERFQEQEQGANKGNAIASLKKLMDEKQLELQGKIQALKNFKVKNGVLDVNNQASTLIGQIADFEARKQEAQKNISAYSGALRNIDARFDPSKPAFAESANSNINQEITATRNQLAELNEQYVRSQFDSRLGARIDSLQNRLSARIRQSSEAAGNSALAPKKELASEKLDLEVSLEMAKNSVSSLSEELSRLNGKLYALVPDQAAIKALQDDIDLRSREYVELTNKYNEALLGSGFTARMTLSEQPAPGIRQSSGKLLLVVLAGALSLLLIVLGLLAVLYFDHAVTEPAQLANATSIGVIGSLNLLTGKSINLEDIWSKRTDHPEWLALKNQFRAIRSELEQLAPPDADGRTPLIAITSLRSGDGKTFVATNLAYAFAMIHKKVLLIDGNFHNPQISEQGRPDSYIEDYLRSGKEGLLFPSHEQSFVVLGNEGGDVSLLEAGSQEVPVATKLELLKSRFDVILVEVPALEQQDKAKEWLRFADKVVATFKSGTTIGSADQEHIAYLAEGGNKTAGWIFNRVAYRPAKQRPGRTNASKKTKKLAA